MADQYKLIPSGDIIKANLVGATFIHISSDGALMAYYAEGAVPSGLSSLTTFTQAQTIVKLKDNTDVFYLKGYG